MPLKPLFMYASIEGKFKLRSLRNINLSTFYPMKLH